MQKIKQFKSLDGLKRENKGITLIALVITIIVLLILAGISIATLTGDNGILTRAKNAKEETRGASVEEARDLWKSNQKSDNYMEEGTSQTLEELLDDLENQKLITADEKNTIKEQGKIKIGSRTIKFEETVSLVSYVYKADYGDIAEIDIYLDKGYKRYAESILKNKSEEEIIQMFIESEKYYANDFYESEYPDQEITEELILNLYEVNSFQDLAEKNGCLTLNDLMIKWGYVDPEKFEEFENLEKIQGEITCPDGSVQEINEYNDYIEYSIDQDGTYKFSAITSDGTNIEIEVTTNLNNMYSLKADGPLYYLINGFGETVDILEEYNPKLKKLDSGEVIDLSSGIVNDEYFDCSIIDIIESLGYFDEFYGEIWLEKDNKTIYWRGSIFYMEKS